MNAALDFPSFDERLPELNHFIVTLTEEYDTGQITSWDILDKRVKNFFTPSMMDAMEIVVPHWKKTTSYSNGITLTHIMCAFLGLFMLTEFKRMDLKQQQLAKWIVLFHDSDKVHIQGQRDYMHGFRSAVNAANSLENQGFPVTSEFHDLIHSWSELTKQSATFKEDAPDTPIQNNKNLPEILSGIENLFGEKAAASLIVKGALLHMSINVVKEYPQAAPLSREEISRYITPDLLPLLKVMMLSDNEGWVMFYPEVRKLQRTETLEIFAEIENLIL